MSNVHNLTDKSNDNRTWSVVQMLQAVIKEIEGGKIKPNRCLVLMLDDTHNMYNSHFRAANINASQSISLIEIEKLQILRGSGFL